jgi:hypothetical protein
MGNCNVKEEFCRAIESGELVRVEWFLNNNKISDINFHQLKSTNTPLHIAAICGYHDILLLLLKQEDVRVDMRDAVSENRLDEKFQTDRENKQLSPALYHFFQSLFVFFIFLSCFVHRCRIIRFNQ